MRKFLAIVLVVGTGSKYVHRDLGTVAAQYLIVAPPELSESLDPLCDHRSKTYTVAVVRTDDIAARHGPGAQGIAKLVAQVSPKFLLLAGDAKRIPPMIRPSSYVSERFPSDPDLATDHLFGAIAGRFPAKSAEELGLMIAKTVEYETASKPGRWQGKIDFVTGQGNFGPLIDVILEQKFSAVVTENIPQAYDIEMAYAKPSSNYCWYPPKFNENALRMLNEGALFYAYVGHGLRTSFDDVHFQDDAYPIFDQKDAAKVDVRGGLPVMVVIACDTGQFDHPAGDCIGERLFKRRRGPVAFIGGSRTTQPYANGIFGRKLVLGIFQAPRATLGEALWQAQAAVLEPDDSAFRLQADAIAGLVQGPSSLEPMRKDVGLQYNLLGDPALVLQRPSEGLTLRPRGHPGRGRSFVVTGRAPESPVEITFECARNRTYHPTDLVGEDVEKRLARRYLNANNKVIVRTEAPAAGGEFEAELDLPKDLAPGHYVLKARTARSIGACPLEIAE